MLSRPNWEARIAASRTLLEWLAPVIKRSVASPSGRTVVNVVTAPYAAGQTREAHAVVIDVESAQSDSGSEAAADA
jgi:hypothetical protein